MAWFMFVSRPFMCGQCRGLLWETVRVKVTLRQAVYRQSVRLGSKPLEIYDQFAVVVLVYHLLWRRDGGFSNKYAWPLSSVLVHIAQSRLLKIISFALYRNPVYPGFVKQIMPILLVLISCYNGRTYSHVLTTNRYIFNSCCLIMASLYSN
jgi:hypothetical protein